MPGIPLVCSTKANLSEGIDGPNPVLNLTTLKVKPLLPSIFDSSTRLWCCPSSYILTEIYIYFGVAENTLRDLRKYLTVKKYLVNYKIKQVSEPGCRQIPIKGQS